MSHDLRTPLATIRAAAGTLRPGSGLSPEDQQESADAIDREVEYLNRLVTNLLDLSRIEAGALRAERDVFELDDLVGQTVDRLRTRLGDRGPWRSTWRRRRSRSIRCFLDEAVTNALENAIKYTPPDAPIRIVAAALAGEPLGPADGRGRRAGRARRRRCRGSSTSSTGCPGVAGGSRSGTGIGLAVVRGLVEAMGGSVGGATERARRAGHRHRPAVAAIVPADDDGAEASRVSAPATGGAADRRSWSSRTTRRRAPRSPASSRAAATGSIEADRRAHRRCARWESRRPDLVLLDLGLPDIDGLDVVRRIRREATTPIVILSGRYEEREKVEALERGADDYVTKPFGVDELNARLRVALRRAAGPAADPDGRIAAGPLALRCGAPRGHASPARAST